MSQENVDLVVSTLFAPDADLAEIARSDERFAVMLKEVGSAYHADVRFANHGFPRDQTCVGWDAMRRLFRDWYKPWETYRTELEQTIDCGERVLALTREFGVLWGTSQEVSVALGGIYTIRDGKIARWDVYLDRGQALKAVGLEG
jgi:ketosteroid isomerase-like protein